MLHSADALAWGLYTHLFFAQALIWAVPLADPRLRATLRKFPQLVLAGACLPDLALVGRPAGVPSFRQSHQWSTVHRLMQNSVSEEERALTVGYASHLLVDVIAHNHFVPAHETMWTEAPMVAHAASEWAMDAHVQRHILLAPRELLERSKESVLPFLGRHFGCDEARGRRVVKYLGRGDALLRRSRIPEMLLFWAKRLDTRLEKRFDYYIRETASRLPHLQRVLDGEHPSGDPDPGQAAVRVRRAELGVKPVAAFRFRLPADPFWNSRAP